MDFRIMPVNVDNRILLDKMIQGLKGRRLADRIHTQDFCMTLYHVFDGYFFPDGF